jgi:type II secretion system protein H
VQVTTTRHRRRRGGETGFSLIEMLVVIVIIGVIGTIVSLRLLHLGPRYRLEGAARVLAAEIQKARGRAIAEGRCVRVSFQVGPPGTYTVETAAGAATCTGAAFGGGTAVRIEESATIDVANGSGGGPPVSAIFNPRGGSEGTGGAFPTIRLSNSLGDARLVLVNPAGRVSVQ